MRLLESKFQIANILTCQSSVDNSVNHGETVLVGIPVIGGTKCSVIRRSDQTSPMAIGNGPYNPSHDKTRMEVIRLCSILVIQCEFYPQPEDCG